MAAKKKQSLLTNYLKNKKQYPVLVAIAAGLYPILFYFTNNYTIVNTWPHFGYFLVFFLCLPIVVFVVIFYLFKISFLNKFQKHVLPFLNVFTFLFFMMICYYAGIHNKIALLSFFIAVVFALFFYKYSKKVIVIQLLLALIGIFTLTPKLMKLVNYSSEWKLQPDDIENVKFKKNPNVYFIQPDGYANFSELGNENYNIDYSEFESFFKNENFTYYKDFRSNYSSTLSSNSATFIMKHHYYNDVTELNEMMNARENIIKDNPVLKIFKNNNYKTHLITQLPYLLLNKAEMGFDMCNFSNDDISYIGTGLGEPVDIIKPLSEQLNIDSHLSKFFFIEFFNPGHIAGRKEYSKGTEKERDLWEESLQRSNHTIGELLAIIKQKDPNALILIMADHGGFVGMEHTGQSYEKMQNRDLIYSIFSSTLAIKWPNNEVPEYDNLLKTNINVFRILFSYLSDNKKYLNSLQDNESYMIIKKGAPRGVYLYIDNEGEITFKKR